MRVADIVAQTVANFGARRAFGMPGGEVVTLVDALNAASVPFTLTRHETSAAIMAAGAAVEGGGPGVLVTTLGPGLANAVNGIIDANQERVPLLVFAGVIDPALRGRYTHQVFDQAALLTSVVKGTFEITPEAAGATMAEAAELALSDPQGPVLIELSPGTAAKMAADDDQPHAPPATPVPSAEPAADDIARVAAALSKASKPLIIAGWHAVQTGAGADLATFATSRNIPIITTYKAKGLVDETEPLCLGAAGLSPLADRHLLPLVAAADCVLLIGYDPIEMRQGWMNPFTAAGSVIEVGAWHPEHGMHQATDRLTGAIAPILKALDEKISAPRNSCWSCGLPAKTREALQAAFAVPEPWGPHAVFAELEDRLPPEATVTVDSGAHRILLSQQMRFRRPKALLQSAGLCTMNAALPLAAGVKSSSRTRPVVAVLGDGGLEMGIGELATLRDEKLAVVLVVCQDESLALIEMKQRQFGLSKAGVDLGRTPFEDIARAFGGNGWRVTSRSDLAVALDQALAAENFSLIVCEIEASSYDGRI